jgi:hypothetical protein
MMFWDYLGLGWFPGVYPSVSDGEGGIAIPGAMSFALPCKR